MDSLILKTPEKTVSTCPTTSSDINISNQNDYNKSVLKLDTKNINMYLSKKHFYFR